ncbi:hypothetical protein CDAR_581281 [Caerostris darwini]|uniref:Uncharacterized protein n=1 Tax=Caerostris darwini TaxID=1538125 RepID=A0AAV4PM11_9ARAC|nr:hypothetical protein CDAR_581281 [Caerostris darwini]
MKRQKFSCDHSIKLKDSSNAYLKAFSSFHEMKQATLAARHFPLQPWNSSRATNYTSPPNEISRPLRKSSKGVIVNNLNRMNYSKLSQQTRLLPRGGTYWQQTSITRRSQHLIGCSDHISVAGTKPA